MLTPDNAAPVVPTSDVPTAPTAEDVNDATGDALDILADQGKLPSQDPEVSPAPATPAPESPVVETPPQETPPLLPVAAVDPAVPVQDPPDPALAPETQAIVDKRIGEVVAQREQAKGELLTVQTANKALVEQNTALQTTLANNSVQAAQANGTNPMLLLRTEAEILERQKRVMEFKAWARPFERSGQGYDGDGDPEKAMTDEQIVKNLTLADDELQAIPTARALIQRRGQVDAYVDQIYPVLSDTQSPEYQTLQRAMRALPGLNAVADARLLIGDMILGSKIRRQQNAPAAPPAQPAQPVQPINGAPARAPQPPPPPMPVAGPGKPSPQVAPAASQNQGPTAASFLQRGGDLEALQGVGMDIINSWG